MKSTRWIWCIEIGNTGEFAVNMIHQGSGALRTYLLGTRSVGKVLFEDKTLGGCGMNMAGTKNR